MRSLLALSKFGRDAKQVIIFRYGLCGEGPCTLREITGMIGISIENVRQLELRVARTLKKRFTGMRCKYYSKKQGKRQE